MVITININNIHLIINLWQSVAVDVNIFHSNVHQTSRSCSTYSQNLIYCRLQLDSIKDGDASWFIIIGCHGFASTCYVTPKATHQPWKPPRFFQPPWFFSIMCWGPWLGTKMSPSWNWQQLNLTIWQVGHIGDRGTSRPQFVHLRLTPCLHLDDNGVVVGHCGWESVVVL